MKGNLKILLLALLGIFLALACLVWGVTFRSAPVKKPEKIVPLPKQEEQISLPKVVFALSPQKIIKNQGESFTVDILIQSEKNVGAADLFFSYDHQVLSLEEVVPGDFFSEPVEFQKINEEDKGELFYALGSFTPTAGEGVLASLTFMGKAAGEKGLVSFKTETQVGVQDGKEVSRAQLQFPEPGSYTILD